MPDDNSTFRKTIRGRKELKEGATRNMFAAAVGAMASMLDKAERALVVFMRVLANAYGMDLDIAGDSDDAMLHCACSLISIATLHVPIYDAALYFEPHRMQFRINSQRRRCSNNLPGS